MDWKKGVKLVMIVREDYSFEEDSTRNGRR